MTEACEFSSLYTYQLNTKFVTQDEIQKLCEFHEEDLEIPWVEDPKALLLAFSAVETTIGMNNRPRYEMTYAPGGFYYHKSWSSFCSL